MKKYFLLAAIVSLALAGYYAATSLCQSGLAREIELVSGTTFLDQAAASYSTGLVAPNPHGIDVPFRKRFLGVVQVSSAPSAGASPVSSLEVYFQSSLDSGLVWEDFAHVHITGPGLYNLPVSIGPDVTWPTTIPTTTDGNLGNGVLNAYLASSRMRVKYNAIFGGNASGTWSFRVYLIPD